MQARLTGTKYSEAREDEIYDNTSTRACPLVLPVFLSETCHRALPKRLNKDATCNKTLIERLKLPRSYGNDLLNHYLGQGTSSLPAGVYQVICAAFRHR